MICLNVSPVFYSTSCFLLTSDLLPFPGHVAGAAILTAGCDFHHVRSACFDVPGLLYTVTTNFFGAAVEPSHWPLPAEIEYHKRMNVLTSMGLLTMFQFARNSSGGSLTAILWQLLFWMFVHSVSLGQL